MCENKRLILLKDIVSQFLQTNSECPELFFVDEIKWKQSKWKYGIRSRQGWGLAYIGDDSVIYVNTKYEDVEIKVCDPDFFTKLLTALRFMKAHKEKLNAPGYHQTTSS